MKMGLAASLLTLTALSAAFFFFRLYEDYLKEKEAFLSAQSYFEEGLHVKESEVKEEAFNRAAGALLSKEPKSASFQAALGIILAELREFPFSIYYLKSALMKDPDNTVLQNQLVEVTKRAGIHFSPIPKPYFCPKFFIFFTALLLLSLLFLTVTEKMIFLGILFLALIPFTFFGSIELYKHFFTPIQAVLIETSDLYERGEIGSSAVLKEPLPAGLTLLVIDSQLKGEWFQVLLENGAKGYLPSSAIRVLR